MVPLSRLATSLSDVGTAYSVAAPADEFKAALRNRLLAVGAVTSTPPAGLAAPAPWRRRLVAASAVLAVSTGSGAGLAVASGDALPGDRLYEVKRAIENVRLALAPNDIARGERYLAIASTRLAEINAMLAANPNAAADPALVQELRETMSAMAEAVAAGSALFFEVFERTGDATVLATLAQFLSERSLDLSTVSGLMPVQLLMNQASLLVELEGLAARLAYVTGRHPELAQAVADAKDKHRADRNGDRAVLVSSASAIAAALEAMRVAAEAAQAQAAEASAAQAEQQSQEEQEPATKRVQRDVDGYIQVNVAGSDGTVDGVSVATLPNTQHERNFNTGSLKGSPAKDAGSSSQQLLWSLPVPTNDVGASTPAGLSANFSPTGDNTAQVAAQ